MNRQQTPLSKPSPGLVTEYENLLRSLLPKLDEYDRARVLEKVTLLISLLKGFVSLMPIEVGKAKSKVTYSH